MISNLKWFSLIALVGTLAPCLIYFAGLIDLNTMKWGSLIATIGWFVITPFWLGRDLEKKSHDEPAL